MEDETMKTIKRVAVSALALLTVGATFPACKGSDVVKDAKTINVKMLKAGFGTSWAEELKSNFEKAYASEGYKVNIISPSSDMRADVVLNDLYMGYAETGVDLYITGDIQSAQVGTKNSYETGAPLVEDTTELVYNQPAIRYDGTYEDKKVSEKLSANMNSWLKDEASHDSDKVYYGVPYVASSAGLVVNMDKLAKYGYTEAPRTSDEIVEMAMDIYLGKGDQKNSKQSKIYPFTYFNNENNAGGYGITWLYSMLAQYDYEAFEQVLNYTEDNDKDGVRVDFGADGYEYFNADNNKGLLSALELMYFVYDRAITCPGSPNQALDKGQAAIMREGTAANAVFMANGDWFLNEVELNYDKDVLKNVDFVNYPVNSLIGEEEFCASLGIDEEKADELLSYICKLVDENKEIADIITEVKTKFGYDVTEKSVKRVADARGLNYSRGIESQCFITKGSDKKDITALFLRMMASDDCAETMAKEANATSAFTQSINTYAEFDFVKNASKMAVNKYAKPYRWATGGLRKKMNVQSGILPKLGNPLAEIYKKVDNTTTMFDYENATATSRTFEIYTNQAKAMLTTEYEWAKSKWAEWLDTAAKAE